MARLRITFRYLSLIAVKKGGVVVSLPGKGHTAYLYGLNKTRIKLSDDVWIVQDGHRRWGQAVATDLKRYIKIEKISGKTMGAAKGVVDGTRRKGLSSRIYLSGGTLKTVNPYVKPTFKNVRWEVYRGKKRVVNQTVTDSMTYELSLDKKSTYALRVNEKNYPIGSKGLSISIENLDPPTTQPVQTEPPYSLDEFVELYGLFEGQWKSLPVPVARKAPKIASVPGPNRPMCSSLWVNF